MSCSNKNNHMSLAFQLSHPATTLRTTSSSSSSTSLSMSAALIVQNKGGGHGELGFQLAKNLQSNPKITSITILQDDACNDEQEPFKSYATDIPDVKIVKANLSSSEDDTIESLQSILGQDASFDYIWDNCSKSPTGPAKALCDAAKHAWNTKLYTYVSSAGIYQPDESTTFPMNELTTPIKSTAGQHLFDTYAKDTLDLPYVSFRPQYIYGPNSNKHDYIDWFLHRLTRNLPLPIPGDGNQKVSLTNSRDVASILASVLNDEQAAIDQCYFNCGTDRLLTYNDVVHLCADAANIPQDEVHIEYYDADMFGKATFPFRMTDFYVAPDAVKEILKWDGPVCDLAKDLKDFYHDSFLARGGHTMKLPLLVKDWEIVVGHRTSFEIGSVYDKYIPIEFDCSDVKELLID
eukprot:CAMPEP_0184868346 /NCGR_PEP_ID=MMETSP0580-20130426/30167_1 /TAXON_ID=1118495 /ORGANISM="Dactyliosolen fragilissimus" /LENGTH=405 /DNA_ID=CAMNT_0027369185 /DNA_START=117 /DNA_END=1334 /DNA_ORIENTATION=-